MSNFFKHLLPKTYNPFFLIAGPCVIENYNTTFETAKYLKEISEELKIPFIFKSSFDKANRTSAKSFRGPGFAPGLEILNKIKQQLDIKIISDIHLPEQALNAGKILDIIQIPAFLCRQTDLISAAAQTGKPINIKKGQFLAPWEVKNIINKALSAGATDISITERGTTFGYNNLIVDFRGIEIIKKMGVPVIFDATHSVQLPGGDGKTSGGQRKFAPTLAKAAIAAGADGIFIETHPNPDKALCDGPNSIALNEIKKILEILIAIKKAVKN
ncbi:MAG: 3-deoxy-8-phosphooctulonate synthase [Desulfobacteraceae bacterium 4572_130]|nr:MAG: 3-deoxy-8-phosphooctulonate synthase [Desulfobacteraceae bacterium 4572_130]